MRDVCIFRDFAAFAANNDVIVQEIVTGKAYAKARVAAEDAYTKAHAAAHPHMQKAWDYVGPTFTKLYDQIKVHWDKLQVELSKEPYSTYVAKCRQALKALTHFALGMRARAIDLWNSDEVRTGTTLYAPRAVLHPE